MSKKNVESWFDFGGFPKLKILFMIAFGILFFVVWLPLPFIFPWKEYVPGPFGIPINIWFWVGVQILSGIVFLILIYWPKARTLYESEEEE